jgi:hypothetical protein
LLYSVSQTFALADAHITDCHNIKAYQVEPTPIIQLDQSRDYAIQNPINNIATEYLYNF